MNASKEVVDYVELHTPYPTYIYTIPTESASLTTGDAVRHIDPLLAYMLTCFSQYKLLTWNVHHHN